MVRIATGLLVLAACGPSVATPADADTSGGATSSSSGTTRGETTMPITSAGEAGTAPATSVGSSSDGSTSSSGGEDTTTGPASICDPQPEPIAAHARLDSDDIVTETIVIDATCTLDAIEDVDEDSHRYTFSCAEAEGSIQHVLELSTSPPRGLTFIRGAQVQLLAHRTAYIDIEARLFVALRDVEGQLAFAYHGSIDVPPEVDPPSWYAPFELDLDTDQCDPEPYEPPDPDSGSFIADPCPVQAERAAFMVRSPWAIGLVYESTSSPFGDYEVIVPLARTTVPVGDEPGCPTLPRDRGSVMILPNL